MSKILHLCVSNYYSDGHLYQENALIGAHVAAGHEVLVIASTEYIAADGRLAYGPPRDYVGPEGARVMRLPYAGWLPARLRPKLRIHPGLYRRIAGYGPDVMLFHGFCGWELGTAARYARDNRHVPLYVDTHTDWNNSARSWASRELLHKRFYRPIVEAALPHIRQVLCTTSETMSFARDFYRVPEDKLELFPLGGHPLPDADYFTRRDRTRAALGLGPEHILLVQSGKFTAAKKLGEALAALASVPDPRLRLAVAGVLQPDVRAAAQALMAADRRVLDLGWQSSEALTDLLCAADVYLQPGTQSVTMQHALCCRCAVILDDVPAHAHVAGNGWLIGRDGDLPTLLAALPRADLGAMAARSFCYARETLDYRRLAERVAR